MTYSVERLAGEPIVVLVHQSKQMMQEMPEVMAALFKILDAEPEPMYVVMDIRGVKIDMDDMTKAAGSTALKADAPLHHPKIRESLLVTDDGLIRIAAQGMRTATFGHVKIRAFGTPDDALAYCREKIAQEAAAGKRS